MKKINILLTGLILVGISACNDFLDVDPPSKFENKDIYANKDEANRALNGVYAQLLSGDLYGNAYMGTFCLNSDVDMAMFTNEMKTNNSYRRFDCSSTGGEIDKFWTAAYRGVEYANNFIYNLEHSELLTTQDTELMQMLGEAKVMRAMFYHDLIVMFGDIPFSLIPTYASENEGSKQFMLPVTDREEIHEKLIEDLKSIAPYMSFATDLAAGVERVSKEFCWSMIARMALTCGGYSLRPNLSNPKDFGTMERPTNYRDYYDIARAYCDSVISSGTHALNLPYRQVFVDQCNYIVNSSDDPIFEIPFGKNSTGNVGYLQGPTGENYEGETSGKNIWGKSNGNGRFSAFYRFSFDEEDARLDFVNGLWYYLYDGTPSIRRDYTVHNNKWSKFWQTTGNAMGVDSDNNTGINYPYMRYADVLLMYAETVNELEDGVSGANGAKAIDAFRQVRSRAFTNAEKISGYIASVSGSKEDFLKAVLNERKWEFGGENMRWKDLVRNNMYNEVIYYSFLRYYSVGENAGGYSDYTEVVQNYDGKPGYLESLPAQMYYRVTPNLNDKNIYPNTSLDVLDIHNPYNYSSSPSGTDWKMADFYAWWADNPGSPTNQCLYSFYGFIRGDQQGNINVVIGPGEEDVSPMPNSHTSLPVVRYILPYPNSAIQRSAGEYKNYYGY